MALYNPLVNHLLIIFKARSMIQLFKTFVEYLLIPKNVAGDYFEQIAEQLALLNVCKNYSQACSVRG